MWNKWSIVFNSQMHNAIIFQNKLLNKIQSKDYSLSP